MGDPEKLRGTGGAGEAPGRADRCLSGAGPRVLPSAALNAAGHLRGQGRCQGRKEELTLGMWVPVSGAPCPWHRRAAGTDPAGLGGTEGVTQIAPCLARCHQPCPAEAAGTHKLGARDTPERLSPLSQR